MHVAAFASHVHARVLSYGVVLLSVQVRAGVEGMLGLWGLRKGAQAGLARAEGAGAAVLEVQAKPAPPSQASLVQAATVHFREGSGQHTPLIT
jgi:hypothetical protein